MVTVAQVFMVDISANSALEKRLQSAKVFSVTGLDHLLVNWAMIALDDQLGDGCQATISHSEDNQLPSDG
jgi:hypothetical protein